MESSIQTDETQPKSEIEKKWYQFESVRLSWSEWVLAALAIVGILVILSLPAAKWTDNRAGVIWVVGESMHESVPYGSFVFCLPFWVHNGDLVIAMTKNGLVVKRLSYGALISENFFGERFEQGTFTVLSKVLLVVYSPLYVPAGSVAAERNAAHASLKNEVAKQESSIMRADAKRICRPISNELDLRQIIRNGGGISAFGTMKPTLAVDGDPKTFWAPALAGDSWWQLKLDKPRKVVVDFGLSAGVDGKNVKASLDGKSWHLIKMTTTATPPTYLKYLRIWGEQDGDLNLNMPLNLTEVRVTPCN